MFQMDKTITTLNMYKFLNEKKEHLHTLNGRPLKGATTIVDAVCPKPLTWWASARAVSLFGWLDPKKNSPESVKLRAGEVLEQIKGLDRESYLALLNKAYRAHYDEKETSAEAGTDLHSEIEKWVKGQIAGENVPPHDSIIGFVEWAKNNVVEWLWSEGYSYNEDLWVGGIVDLGFKDKDGKVFIGDIKSAKEAYFAHFLQCGIYKKLVEKNGILDKDGNQILPPQKIDGFAVFPKGKNFEPSIRYATELWDEGVESAVKLYNLVNTQ